MSGQCTLLWGRILYEFELEVVWESGLSCRVHPTRWLCCALNALMRWHYMNFPLEVGQWWNRLIFLFFLWLLKKKAQIVSDQGDPFVCSCPVAAVCSIAHTVRAWIPSSTKKCHVKLWVSLRHIQTSEMCQWDDNFPLERTPHSVPLNFVAPNLTQIKSDPYFDL